MAYKKREDIRIYRMAPEGIRAYRMTLHDPSMAEFFGSTINFPDKNYHIRKENGLIVVKEGIVGGTCVNYDLVDVQPAMVMTDTSFVIKRLDQKTAERIHDFAKKSKTDEKLSKDLEALLR